MELKVIAESRTWMVIFKPAGLCTDRQKYDINSVEEIIHNLNHNYKAVHRIDRPVSGCLLVAKNKSSNAFFTKIWNSEMVLKRYIAIVSGKMEYENGNLIHNLVKDNAVQKAIISKTHIHEKTKAQLKYKTLATSENHSLLQIALNTGKYHQIRAQLAFEGNPIVGDEKYGSTEYQSIEQIYLHSYLLRFTCPDTGNIKIINAMPQKFGLWSSFDSDLKLLKSNNIEQI